MSVGGELRTGEGKPSETKEHRKNQKAAHVDGFKVEKVSTLLA
jgi:hypothetical protein